MTSGYEKVEDNGVQYWRRERISAMLERSREAKSWEELVAVFVAGRQLDMSRLPKSSREVQTRFRQVETAYWLSKRRGQSVRIVGSREFDEGQTFRVVGSTPESVNLMNPKFLVPKTTSLRRFEVDEKPSVPVLRVATAAGVLIDQPIY